MKIRTALLSAALLLSLTGCAGAVESSSVERTAPAETPPSAPVEAKSEAANSAAAPTAPGEVCDAGNANDVICAAFYPDQAVLNIAARNDSLAGLGDDVIPLAKEECAALRGEGSSTGNPSLISAATVAYCPEFAKGPDDYPDLIERRINYYQSIGEDAARAEFSDGTMPTPEVLGY